MSDGGQPGVMRPEEYPQVMEVLERAFGYPRHYWLAQYPGVAEDRFVFDDHFVMREEGRVVAQAAIYPYTMMVDGTEVPMGGVGGVATDPAFQGRGHFSRLMHRLNEEMRGRGMALAVLWGMTPRYRHFGYEPAGRRLVFRLAAAPGHADDDVVETMRGFEPGSDLAWTHEARRREAWGVRRSERMQEQCLTGPGLQTWVNHREGEGAYVVLRDGRAIECVGDPTRALELLAHLRHRYFRSGFEVVVSYRDSPLARGLFDLGANWRVETIGMFRVLDLVGTLRAFAPQMQGRALAAGLPHGSLALHNQDTGELASLAFEGEVAVGSDAQAPISLTASQLTRLLLGPTLERLGEDAGQQRMLDCFFPLNLYLHPVDSV